VGKLQKCDDLTASEADEWLVYLQNADKEGFTFGIIYNYKSAAQNGFNRAGEIHSWDRIPPGQP